MQMCLSSPQRWLGCDSCLLLKTVRGFGPVSVPTLDTAGAQQTEAAFFLVQGEAWLCLEGLSAFPIGLVEFSCFAPCWSLLTLGLVFQYPKVDPQTRFGIAGSNYILSLYQRNEA